MNVRPDRPKRDEGSALILALVMIIVGSLIVAGMSTYAISVLRANHVLSARTQRAEAVKAGLRMAFASPKDLYEYCGPDNTGTYVWADLAPVTINGMQVNTRCHTIDVASALSDDERRLGLAATRIGEVIPTELTPADAPDADPPLPPSRYNDMATATDTHLWLSAIAEQSVTGTIWRPRLPSHGTSFRSAVGTTMPTGWPTCRVFFPGTYIDPVILDGPTFFASGVYYFESEVRVIGGADVVFGDGSAPGCEYHNPPAGYKGPLSVSTQDALYYAERVPGEHFANGYGATLVFGDKGRLVITNDPTQRDRNNVVVGKKPISFTINRRYNQATDYEFLPSSDVAIITVDGELVDNDSDPSTPMVGVDLDAPGRIFVPQSKVGADDPATTETDEAKLATTVEYKPSVFTPKPRQPDQTTWPASGSLANRGTGRVLVTWNAPAFDGGAAITKYVVTASTGQTCETLGSLSCLVTGLPSAAVSFTVVAYNHSNLSDTTIEVPSLSSLPASITVGSGSAPSAPTGVPTPNVALFYDQTISTDPANSVLAHVSWGAASSPNAPITGYTVEMVPNDGGPTLTCSLDMTDSWIPAGWTERYPRVADQQCDIRVPLATGAVPTVLPQYQVTVKATNAMGTSTSPQRTISAVTADRVDMPVQCDNPATTTVNEGVPRDNNVSAAELTAWLTNAPLPTATCASPAFSGAQAMLGLLNANELIDHDSNPATPPVPRHSAHVVPRRDGQPPTPVVDVELVDDTAGTMPPVKVSVPSYVSLAQGRIKVVNPEAHEVNIVGGVMAAMFDIQDGRVEHFDNGAVVPGTVKIGYEAAAIQRKLEIVSTISAGRESSTAIVQVNQNGAYAINSWEVQ